MVIIDPLHSLQNPFQLILLIPYSSFHSVCFYFIGYLWILAYAYTNRTALSVAAKYMPASFPSRGLNANGQRGFLFTLPMSTFLNITQTWSVSSFLFLMQVRCVYLFDSDVSTFFDNKYVDTGPFYKPDPCLPIYYQNNIRLH